MSHSEQCSNRLRLDLILSLVRFDCELGQIINQWSFWVNLGSHNYTLSFILIYMSSNLIRTIWVKIKIWRKKSIFSGSCWAFTQNPGVLPGAPKCQLMQTSSQWRHMYNKGKQLKTSSWYIRAKMYFVWGLIQGYQIFRTVRPHHISDKYITRGGGGGWVVVMTGRILLPSYPLT